MGCPGARIWWRMRTTMLLVLDLPCPASTRWLLEMSSKSGGSDG
jgi:hypothetical protein